MENAIVLQDLGVHYVTKYVRPVLMEMSVKANANVRMKVVVIPKQVNVYVLQDGWDWYVEKNVNPANGELTAVNHVTVSMKVTVII